MSYSQKKQATPTLDASRADKKLYRQKNRLFRLTKVAVAAV